MYQQTALKGANPRFISPPTWSPDMRRLATAFGSYSNLNNVDLVVVEAQHDQRLTCASPGRSGR